MEIGCIVLTGGKGLRLGREKASEVIGNKSLIQRVVSSLSVFKSNIIIVTNVEQLFIHSINCPEVRIVTDVSPGKGPLGGIYTGLATSDLSYNLVVACDMPFLNQALLEYMVKVSANSDLVIPRLGNMVEPLHALYSKKCLAPVECLLKQGNLSIRELFSLVRVRYVETEEIDRFDPRHLSFFNINTEADLRKAKELEREISNDKR